MKFQNGLMLAAHEHAFHGNLLATETKLEMPAMGTGFAIEEHPPQRSSRSAGAIVAPARAPGSKIYAKLKTRIFRMSYWLAYRLAPSIVYTRQPFVRYPYMYRPSEMMELTRQLLSVEATGCAVEVGCNQGWTSLFLLEAMAERGVKRDYVCIDTFTGFTPEDAGFEYRHRGKPAGIYDECFLVNDPEWLKGSLARAGHSSHVAVHKADATKFDYRKLGRIAFAIIDVDLYRPVRRSLERIMPYMAPGGLVVVDDCDRGDDRWDGAYQAYMDFCVRRNYEPKIVSDKFGIIQT